MSDAMSASKDDEAKEAETPFLLQGASWSELQAFAVRQYVNDPLHHAGQEDVKTVRTSC